jgi:hypothetical protein
MKFYKKFNIQGLFAVLFVFCLFFNFAVYVRQGKDMFSEIKSVVKQEMESGHTISEVLGTAISEADEQIQDNIWQKDGFVSLNGLFQRLIGKNVVEDVVSRYTIYKMTNGQLTFDYPLIDVSDAVEQMKDLQSFCEERGVNLLYVQIPYKVDKYDSKLPDGYLDGPNTNADNFLAGIADAGISYLDYREVLHEESEVAYETLFFDGDHHWRTETAFDYYVYLMRYLGQTYGYPVNETFLDLSNFKLTTYEKLFMGSQVKRVHSLYADVIDDFTLIEPDFETSMTHEFYNKNGKLQDGKTKTGTFSEAVLQMSVLKNLTGPTQELDRVYLGHNPYVDVITNHDEEDGSILIVEDSFSRSVSSFLSLQFHETHVMDLRYYKKSLKDYLDAHSEIKTVVISYSASVFEETTIQDQFEF